jgi:uncharacterized protein (DUF302 family)
MRLSRHWMTGCMALVMLIAGRVPLSNLRAEGEPGEQRRWRVESASQRPLDETLVRLSDAARRHGLAVLATVPPATMADLGSGARVVVLGRRDGQTPVVQQGDAGAALGWSLPLRLVVHADADGSTRVSYEDPSILKGLSELPADVQADLALLPRIVAEALQPAKAQA